MKVELKDGKVTLTLSASDEKKIEEVAGMLSLIERENGVSTVKIPDGRVFDAPVSEAIKSLVASTKPTTDTEGTDGKD